MFALDLLLNIGYKVIFPNIHRLVINPIDIAPAKVMFYVNLR
jgi:hypothetical protein